MAFEEIQGKGGIDMGLEGEMGLAAGRSQREKRRSYKDLLREEEEIAAQVRKSSKKRPKDAEHFMLGGDSHKKKKKHSDDYYYRDHDGSGPPPHKKKHKSADRSPPLSSPSSSTDTAMGLLQAITSPLATGSDPSPHMHKKPSYPSFSSHSSKDRKRDSSSTSGNKGSHSFPQSRPASSSSSSSSKKHSSSSSSSKLSLFHGGAAKEEPPLTLREADGLKMKLIMSPEKEEAESFPLTLHSSKGGVKKEKDRDRTHLTKSPKKKQQQQQSRDPLPVVGKEVEVEGHYGGGMGDDSSSSGGELEAGELVIDDSYTHLSKKKKKSKKSKKKKDKEKDRDRDKSGKDKKHSKGFGDSSRGHSHSHPTVTHSTVGPMYAMGTPIPPHHHPPSDGAPEKKKKKEEKDRDKHEKEKDKPKKKNTTAYQVFCKEYRVNINAEQPGLVFGELSKKLAEVWKAMPEKDKLVWRQKAQYLQHKQNKAEATTIKHKSSSESKSKVVGTGAGMVSPNRTPSTMSLSPARVPDVDPIDAAAHLQLLGESLSLIGHRSSDLLSKLTWASASTAEAPRSALELPVRFSPEPAEAESVCRNQEVRSSPTRRRNSRTNGGEMSASASHSGDLRLVVLGRTGAGKRCAVCAILGLRDSEQGTEAAATECIKHRGEAGGRKVAVVSCPPWFGSGCNPEERRKHISSFIALSSPGPHAFLLCLPVNEPADEEAKALAVLKKLFGPSAVSRHTIVLFTHTEELEEDEQLEEYLVTWRKDLQELLDKCGGRYHTLETRGGEAEDEKAVVEELLEKVERAVRESGEPHLSCPLYQEAEEKVRERQVEMVKERGGEENATEEEMEGVRDEAERSVGDLNVDIDSIYPPTAVAPAPTFLWSLWEKLTGWTKWLPALVRRESLFGALVGLFVGGPFGGMVGATVGSVATEVGRRKTEKTK